LRRGISELIGGAFERLFCPEGREFEQANLQKVQIPGGWMLKLRFDWYIKGTTNILTCPVLKFSDFETIYGWDKVHACTQKIVIP